MILRTMSNQKILTMMKQMRMTRLGIFGDEAYSDILIESLLIELKQCKVLKIFFIPTHSIMPEAF